jgi:hypothetical protein
MTLNKANEDKDKNGGTGVATLLPDQPRALKKDEIDEDESYCVLHGWGRVAQGAFHFVDETRFDDGVARNVSGIIVKRWMTGRQKNGEMAQSRVFLQAVMANEATEGDFARVTGIEIMPAQRLAQMIKASDLQAVLNALGPKDAQAIAYKLLELTNASVSSARA